MGIGTGTWDEDRNWDRGWGHGMRTWMGTQDRDRVRDGMETWGGNMGWSRDTGDRGWDGNRGKRAWIQGLEWGSHRVWGTG